MRLNYHSILLAVISELSISGLLDIYDHEEAIITVHGSPLKFRFFGDCVVQTLQTLDRHNFLEADHVIRFIALEVLHFTESTELNDSNPWMKMFIKHDLVEVKRTIVSYRKKVCTS